MLGVSDPDDIDTAITIQVSNVTNGKFVNTDVSATAAVTTFTLDAVNDGDIKFIHDGGARPTFSVAAKDDDANAAFDTPVVAEIYFYDVNDAPTVISPSLSMNEGDTVTLTSAHLGVSDADDADNAGYNINLWSILDFQKKILVFLCLFL